MYSELMLISNIDLGRNERGEWAHSGHWHTYFCRYNSIKKQSSIQSLPIHLNQMKFEVQLNLAYIDK